MDDCGIDKCFLNNLRRVRLYYPKKNGTILGLFNAIDNSDIDLLPAIKAGETDTKLELIKERGLIRYYPELFLSSNGTKGKTYDICIKDIAELIKLDDLADVYASNPTDGNIIIYDKGSNKWVLYDLKGKLDEIEEKIGLIDVGDTVSTLHTVFRMYRSDTQSIVTQVIGSEYVMPRFNATTRLGSPAPEVSYSFEDNSITVRNTSTYSYMVRSSAQVSIGTTHPDNGVAFVYTQIRSGAETLGETGGAYIATYDMQVTSRGVVVSPGSDVTLSLYTAYGYGQPFGCTGGEVVYDTYGTSNINIQSFFEVQITGTLSQ